MGSVMLTKNSKLPFVSLTICLVLLSFIIGIFYFSIKMDALLDAPSLEEKFISSHGSELVQDKLNAMLVDTFHLVDQRQVLARNIVDVLFNLACSFCRYF